MSEPKAAARPELRVALFTGNYNYIKDGVALTLNRLVAFLMKRGIAVLVLAPTGPVPAFASVGEVVSVPSLPIPSRAEYRLALGLPKSARERLKAFRPTLFHIAVPDLLGYRAMRLAARWNLPVVASFHTRYDTYLKFYGLGFLEGLGQRYMRWFFNRCQRVYPPSQSMAEIIRSEGLSQRVEVWSRGVDSDLFSPTRRDALWRRAQGIADNEVIISFVGRLVKEKNTDLVNTVFQQLKARGVAFRAMVVGDGPELDAMRRAVPQGIFPGFLNGEDLARAYASSDIFFFPSESETFGNVTLEAMASGLPAVNAVASGSNSLVVEGETGFLCDASRPDAFVERLACLAADGGLRATMGAAARARALTFSWEHILSELVASYYRVLAEGPEARDSPPADDGRAGRS